MSSENGDRPPREIKNHLLFEIATEVAHRGTFYRVGPKAGIYKQSIRGKSNFGLILIFSWWHLFRY